MQAVKEVHGSLIQGYTQVVDADLSKYFDSIAHADLMRSVALRIVDRQVLSLLKSWLQAAVQGDTPNGPIYGAGKSNTFSHAHIFTGLRIHELGRRT